MRKIKSPLDGLGSKVKGNSTGGGSSVPSTARLLEDGSARLMEDGSYRILE